LKDREMNDRKVWTSMIVTNLDHVKGADIKESLGLAFGYAAVTSAKKGRRSVSMGGESWPWADTPDHFEALFREAEKTLIGSALEMGADAVIKIEARLSRDPQGNPEMLLVGTAVRLLGEKGGSGKTGETEIPPDKDQKEGIHITIDGESAAWEMDTSTARKDVLRMMKQRDPSPEGPGPGRKGPMEADLQSLAEVMGISFERAQQLSAAGLFEPEQIAKADLKVLLSLPNMNPTQARIIRSRAKELLAVK
jgi:uncharacterized protein YbjQ (UPF0145 family)